MKRPLFRSVDFWKSALKTMPDSSFFELLKSVFGKIKTPFSKQQLLNDLEAFLLREDIQNTIASYIDGKDAKIIAAVAVLGEPAPGELESFFSGEFSLMQLHDSIVNLEERFILYRFYEEKGGSLSRVNRLALNPVLKKALLSFAEDISVLFQPRVPQPASPDRPGNIRRKTAPAAHSANQGLNDAVIAGIFSFVLQFSREPQAFFKSAGVIRGSIKKTGKAVFPGIDLEQIILCLRILGLFYCKDNGLFPDMEKFRSFCELSPCERTEYCAAAMIVSKDFFNTIEILPPVCKGRIRETFIFIHGFLNFLEPRIYSLRDLEKIAIIHKVQTESPVNTAFLTEALVKTGLIAAEGSGFKPLNAFAHNGCGSRPVTVDSAFSILVYPEINLLDALSLAFFLNIKETGAIIRFELDKDSAVRAFDKGIKAEEMIAVLKRLSGNKLNDTLAWNLKEWEKRHQEVSLKRGTVLTLSEDKRYLAKTQPLASMICETLAEGVYLLGENKTEEAAAAIHGTGIDIIARRNYKEGENEKKPHQAKTQGEHFKAAPLDKASFAVNGQKRLTGMPNFNGAGLKEKFLFILENMPVSKTEQAELSARINRRLILCEEQLKDADIRYEKLEARLMDYSGKQNIAKQAIAARSPVEIILQSGREKEKSIYGIPSSLEKEEGGLILVITHDSADGREEIMRIPLAKISLLRRVKRSIFENF